MRRLVAVVAVAGGLVFSVFVVREGTVAEQVAYLADAGISPANRDAVCPVRLDPDYAADAGLGIYQRLKFGVTVRTLPDGGRDVQLPPMPLQRVRDALDVVDWNDCALSASTPAVASLWGTKNPFTLVGVVKPWCRAALGKSCLRAWPDGGTSSFGFGNVYPCAQAVDPATCQRVSSGVIFYGDDERDL